MLLKKETVREYANKAIDKQKITANMTTTEETRKIRARKNNYDEFSSHKLKT